MVRRSNSGKASYAEEDSDGDDGNYSPKKGSAKKSNKKTPRGKISPFKTPASKKRNQAEEDPANYQDYSDEELGEYGTPPPEPPKKKLKKISLTPSKKKAPAKATPASKKKAASAKKRPAPSPAKKSPARGKARKSYAESESEVEEVQDDDDGSDYDEPPKKKGRAPPPKKGKKKAPPPKGKKKPTGRYVYIEDDEEEESPEEQDQDSDESYDSDYEKSHKKGKATPKKGVKPAPKQKKEYMPPVSEMVYESIKALKDHPKKGSTLSSIKETISLNWPVDMARYNNKIKKYITNAVALGEITQVKGKGFRGRFTIPGMKPPKRRKKPKSALGAKWDKEEEPEYQAKITKRDEEREKDKLEMERRREERAIWNEKIAADKAARPKKPPPPKREEWNVEGVKGMREAKDGKKLFLIKWEGYAKTTWEPEANVEGNTFVADYMEEMERKKEEREAQRKLGEENGQYEVQRILDWHEDTKDKKRVFKIRWKGWGPSDDSWEDEEDLTCPELIAEFMKKVEKQEMVSVKELRDAPKSISRFEYDHETKRKRKTKGKRGYRMIYEDMC